MAIYWLALGNWAIGWTWKVGRDYGKTFESGR